MEFIKAKPIWLEGLENGDNVMAGFRTKAAAEGKAELKIASPCLFRVFVNGRLVGSNTKNADGRHIFLLEIMLSDEENIIAIELISGDAKPHYLCAELSLGGEILCASGYDFNGVRLYAQDRGVDFWKLSKEEKHWKDDETMFDSSQLVDTDTVFEEKPIKLAAFESYSKGKYIESGMLESALADEKSDYDASKYIREYLEAHKIKIENLSAADEIMVREGGYVLIELDNIFCGHILTELVANKDSRFNIAVGISAEKALNPDNESDVTAFELNESINTYELTSFNVYNIKYAVIAVTSGELVIKEFAVLS